MENIINDILAIDLEAQKRLEESIEKRNQIIREANEKESEIKCSILNRADNRLVKVEAFYKKNSDEVIEQINSETKTKVDKINQVFAENHQQWEENIFNNIIGG